MREKLYSFELKNTSHLYKVALSLIDYSDNIFNCEIINFVQTYKFDLSNMTDHRKYEYILGRYGSVKAVEQLMECSRLYIKSGIFNNPYLIGVDSIDISIAHSDNYVTAIAFDRDIIIGLDCQTIDTRTSIENIWNSLTNKEKEIINSCLWDPEKMITAFWTMKESIAKAIKTGLMMAMDILEITEIVYSNDKIMGYMKNFSQYKIATYIVDDLVISIAFPKVLDICGLNLNKRS